MTQPLELFQRIYIISLATRLDRRAEMVEQLARVGYSLESSNVKLFEAIRPVGAGPFPSVGARGCFMSHLGVLRDATTSGLQRILILEDDLNFSAEFLVRASQSLAEAVALDFSIFYGGYELDTPPSSLHGCAEVAPTMAVRTSHFVGFSGMAIASAEAYLASMLTREPGHPAGGPMHVDGAYSWFRRAHPQYRTLLATPVLGYQRASRTDIHDLRWFDKFPGVLHAVAWVRRLRNR